MSSLISKYTKYHLGDEYTSEEFEKALMIEYAIIIGKLQKKSSVRKSIDFLHSHKKGLEDIFRTKEEVEQTMLDWFNNGTIRQSEEYIKLLTAEYNKLKEGLSRDKLDQLSEFFTLDTQLTGSDNTKKKQLLKSLSRFYNS